MPGLVIERVRLEAETMTTPGAPHYSIGGLRHGARTAHLRVDV
jgi:hypothetical protein